MHTQYKYVHTCDCSQKLGQAMGVSWQFASTAQRFAALHSCPSNKYTPTQLSFQIAGSYSRTPLHCSPFHSLLLHTRGFPPP